MRVLLDTHVFLWLHSEPERLGDHLQSTYLLSRAVMRQRAPGAALTAAVR